MQKMKYITFWSRYSKDIDTSIELWLDREIELSELGKLSLLSHARLGNEVILYSYQKIVSKLPDNVELRNADAFYPAFLAYDALQRGQKICYVSDLIRLLHVGNYTGVLIDLDAVVLRKFPGTGFIGSMPTKVTGGFALKWGKSRPPLKIKDNSWDGKALITLLVSVDDTMKEYMLKIATIVLEKLGGETMKGFEGWNAIRRELEKIPVNILHPFYTCPVPPWRGKNMCYSLESPTRLDGRTTLFGHVMPSIDSILDKSLAIQHFFESSFRGEYRTGKGFWDTVKEGSLLAREAEYILGKDWKDKLNESSNVLE